MTYQRSSLALLIVGISGCSGTAGGGNGGDGGGGGVPNDTSACEANVQYSAGDVPDAFTVGHASWCTDCSFQNMVTLDPGFDDHGYTARVVVSPAGQPTVVAVGSGEDSQAVWASLDVSDAVTPLSGVAFGAAFAATDEGAPYVLLPAGGPGQLRLRDPSGAEEILACGDPYSAGLGIAVEGDDIHAVASYSTEEEFLNGHITAFSRSEGGGWSAKPLGELGEGPVAVARTTSGRWLVIGSAPYVGGDKVSGRTLLLEDGSPRQIEIPSPVMEEDFYGPFLQPHPRLRIIPGDDDYFALMSVGNDLVTVLLADGRRVELPAPEFPSDECQYDADECPTECASTGNVTMAASAFVDGDNLFVVMSQYAVDKLVISDCQGSGGNCDCTETVDHDDHYAQIAVARYDLATLSGGVVFEEPVPGDYQEIWMSAAPVGDNLMIAFKQLGAVPVRLGTLDLAMLRSL